MGDLVKGTLQAIGVILAAIIFLTLIYYLVWI